MKQREIKFRAWNKEERKMVFSGKLSELIRETHFSGNSKTNSTPEFSKLIYESLDEEITFLQFTGIYDKNGKEIYDGDICELVILREQREVNPKEALLVVIEYCNASWGFSHLFPNLVVEGDRTWKSFYNSDADEMWDEKYFTIVGNIFENPELLKEKPGE